MVRESLVNDLLGVMRSESKERRDLTRLWRLLGRILQSVVSDVCRALPSEF